MSILFAALLVLPQNAAPVPQASPATAATAPDKVKCRRVPVAGSRLGEKVCKTEAEWKADESGAGMAQGLNGPQLRPIGK